ncbi:MULTISPECIES: GPP34 family phosphoprotein [unclassified Saccharopolyspora]|uniref:GPP34 family phosphoprotein n=1 Tax=unclassified Saccharopolyspora TaxID=2646250 RepID=UPI001CD42E75|nr:MULTISPECIES: GPP34 family phosphoprotein [unclassified Saccharopolyspora]MCA1187186.1 GPP34 family phosphoprotein [Saccharopolyspora sp. 6T]MCA1194308.1 GPP34 family phosphoprotein [Saccharopolyspora sp. 6V]MCA1228092.1 GPP34 family phosphoprotein [Saccharopolyspora sp. 6M]
MPIHEGAVNGGRSRRLPRAVLTTSQDLPDEEGPDARAPDPRAERASRERATRTGRIPLRLADRYFLVAHTGTDRLAARVDPKLVALGCAGGLLAELLLEDEIGVLPTVRPAGKGMPPDFLSWSVLREIRSEPQHSVRTWIQYLSGTATEKVRARLTIIDVVREVPVTGGWRAGPAVAWRPVRLDQRAPAEAVVDTFTHEESAAIRSGMITVPDAQAEVALALLVTGTGVTGRLGLPRPVQRRAEQRAEQWLPRLPAGLRTIVAEVTAAREQWAMTPRR